MASRNERPEDGFSRKDTPKQPLQMKKNAGLGEYAAKLGCFICLLPQA
jgi:hypothetical protein